MDWETFKKILEKDEEAHRHLKDVEEEISEIVNKALSIDDEKVKAIFLASLIENIIVRSRLSPYQTYGLLELVKFEIQRKVVKAGENLGIW